MRKTSELLILRSQNVLLNWTALLFLHKTEIYGYGNGYEYEYVCADDWMKRRFFFSSFFSLLLIPVKKPYSFRSLKNIYIARIFCVWPHAQIILTFSFYVVVVVVYFVLVFFFLEKREKRKIRLAQYTVWGWLQIQWRLNTEPMK